MADEENLETEEVVEIREPQVDSEIKEERIQARRIRIQKRIEAIQKQREKRECPEAALEIEKSLLDKQTEVSALVLEKLLLEGDEVVTNIRVANDTREVRRRNKEAAKRADMLQKIQDESKKAEEMYETIRNKWETILKYKDPLDISDSIRSQQNLCDEIIDQKNGIIKMLQTEINIAESKYVQDQESQMEDLSQLVDRIDNQIDLMRKAYRQELAIIEETINQERTNLNTANDKTWTDLYKQRNADEEENMQKKIAMADDYLEKFQTTRVYHEERYREMKISLERETEKLQQEFEKLKAACLLNGAKLDYNYNILKKREDENLIIRSQQKRVINKLQDEINKLRRNMKEYEQNTGETVNKLTAEIIKARNSIYQIEEKADHICSVNEKKYMEVWSLNENEAIDLMNKIKMSDKIIHEQLLGMEWKAPGKNIIKMKNLTSYKEATEELKTKKQKEDGKEKVPIITLEDGKEIPISLMHGILDKIAYRSGFLLEKVLCEILEDVDNLDQQLIKADNVFSAIGINKPEHFRILANFFLPYARCPICERAERASGEPVKKESTLADQTTEEGETDANVATPGTNLLKTVGESCHELEELVASELAGDITDATPEDTIASESSTVESIASEHMEYRSQVSQKITSFKCTSNHPIYIENAHIFKILKQFVKGGYSGMEKCDQIVTLESRLSHKRNSLSRLISQDDVKYFWSQFLNVFTKQNEELWDGLLFGLKKYHHILEDRQRIFQEVVGLRKENFELRHMLKFCTLEPKKSTKKAKKKLSSPRL